MSSPTSAAVTRSWPRVGSWNGADRYVGTSGTPPPEGADAIVHQCANRKLNHVAIINTFAKMHALERASVVALL
jgi:hypothetical protein